MLIVHDRETERFWLRRDEQALVGYLEIGSKARCKRSQGTNSRPDYFAYDAPNRWDLALHLLKQDLYQREKSIQPPYSNIRTEIC